MTHPPLHYLQCLRALGYPQTFLASTVHPDLASWEIPGFEHTEQAAAALMAFYRSAGERVATPEATGMTASAITKARRNALARGYLPPYAFDEDEAGQHTGDGHADAARTDTGTTFRTDDRIVQTALTVAAEYLANPETTLVSIGESHRLPRVWEAVGPLGLAQVRVKSAKADEESRPILDPERARQIRAAATAVSHGQDPLEVWQDVVGAPFERSRRWVPKAAKVAA